MHMNLNLQREKNDKKVQAHPAPCEWSEQMIVCNNLQDMHQVHIYTALVR